MMHSTALIHFWTCHCYTAAKLRPRGQRKAGLHVSFQVLRKSAACSANATRGEKLQPALPKITGVRRDGEVLLPCDGSGVEAEEEDDAGDRGPWAAGEDDEDEEAVAAVAEVLLA
eukprot:g80161.t1